MDWTKLYSGHISRDEVQRYVADLEWQSLRLSMKGISLERKYACLEGWLKMNNNSRMAQVQVTNYVTALSRGGLIKPGDYLSSL